MTTNPTNRMFRKIPRPWAAGLAAMATIALGASAASAAPVGFVTSVEGIAQVQAGGAATWAPAAVDGGIEVAKSRIGQS